MRSLLLGTLVACAGSTDDVDGQDSDTDDTEASALERLSADGPWDVGFRASSLTYADTTTSTDRTLELGLWFPVEGPGTFTKSFSGPLGPTDVWTDATPAAGPWPLLVFSHGSQGEIDDMSRVMRSFVTHGWVVAAPEHTGNTRLDATRDTELFVQRPFDVSATLDHLADEDLDLDGRTFGVGHSFGGYTMFVLAGATWDVDTWDTACAADDPSDFCSTWTPELAAMMRLGAADDRIDAFATLSGGNFEQLGIGGIGAIDAPLMLQSGALDTAVTNAANSDPIWAALPAGDKVRADFGSGDHFSYTDYAGRLSPPEVLDGERGLSAVTTYLLAFAARHVLDDDTVASILDGTTTVDDDVTLSVK